MLDNYAVIKDVMNSRKSVRKYQPGVSISQNELDEMLLLAGTAPSSWNLQHWRFLVITSQDMKERILPIAYNQRQVVDSSATVVILGDLEANKSAVEVHPEKVYEVYESQIERAYKIPGLPQNEAILNASLAAMQLMLIARAKGYDTCPMGGFNSDALIKELNIPNRFLPIMLITIGKAEKPAHSSSRFGLDKIVIRESF